MNQPQEVQLTLFEADRDELVDPVLSVSASDIEEMTPAEKFDWFHKQNPHVYRALVGLARQRKNRGRKHWSMKAAFEELRDLDSLQTDPKSETTEYKMNNIYTPFYARLIMKREADLAGLFSIRTHGETEE